MARIDMRTMNGDQAECVNLDYPVGVNKANMQNDVMLLQALFILLKTFAPDHKFSRVIESKDLQPVGSLFNQKTLNVIRTYQKASSQVLLKVDGIVEPAKYSGRNIDTLIHHGYHVMTITALDIDCGAAMIGHGGMGVTNHIRYIKSQYPYIF